MDDTGDKGDLKERPSIAFCDFWPSFDPADNPFLTILADTVRPARPSETPDLLVYSDSGRRHRTLAGDATTKIHYTAENIPPNFAECDYGISFEHLDFGDRHLRFPLYAFGDYGKPMEPRPDLGPDDLARRTAFCAYVASNGAWAAPERRDFVRLLHSLRAVTSAGMHLRNHPPLDTVVKSGTGPERKLAFLSDFRFSVAFENSSHPGYTTEKLLDAFRARTIPIYWGDPRVAEEFNREAFVNVHDYPSLEAAARAVIAIDDDPAVVIGMLNAPVFAGGRDLLAEHKARLSEFLRAIVARPPESRRRRPRHGRGRMIELDGRGLFAQLRKSVAGLRQERRERSMPPGKP